MSNPLFNMFGAPNPAPKQNNNILSQFNAFKSKFAGDPKTKVQELLNTGQMSQEQFDQLSQIASQFFNKGGR